MTKSFNIGDKVRVIAARPSLNPGSTARIGYEGKVSRSTPDLATGRIRLENFDWAHPDDLELIETEHMIPASKVREVAEEYAKRYDWYDVVDQALEEMGVTKPKPEMVEVTLTQTRVVRLRQQDLDKLLSDERLDRRVATGIRLNAMFDGGAPIDAELVFARWNRSEPRKLTGEG